MDKEIKLTLMTDNILTFEDCISVGDAVSRLEAALANCMITIQSTTVEGVSGLGQTAKVDNKSLMLDEVMKASVDVTPKKPAYEDIEPWKAFAAFEGNERPIFDLVVVEGKLAPRLIESRKLLLELIADHCDLGILVSGEHVEKSKPKLMKCVATVLVPEYNEYKVEFHANSMEEARLLAVKVGQRGEIVEGTRQLITTGSNINTCMKNMCISIDIKSI